MSGLNPVVIVLIALACAAGACLGWLLRGERQSRSEAVRFARAQDQLRAQQAELNKLQRQRDQLQSKIDDAGHRHHQQKRQLASMREALDEQAMRFRTIQRRLQEAIQHNSDSQSAERKLQRQLELLIRRTAQSRAQASSPPPEQAKKRIDPQDLRQIRGIGPALAKKLNALGIHRLEQLAQLNETDADVLDTQLKFPGRIRRDRWIEQAQELVMQIESA